MEVGGLLRRRPLRPELLQGVRGRAGGQAERQDSDEFTQQWGGAEGKNSRLNSPVHVLLHKASLCLKAGRNHDVGPHLKGTIMYFYQLHTTETLVAFVTTASTGGEK